MRKCLVALLVVVVAAACGGPTDPSDNTVESFSGTVQPSSAEVKTFTISNTGEINVRLTALSPGSGVVVGVLYGQDAGGQCQQFQTNSLVTNNSIGRTVLSGSIIIKGPYCVAVFDPVGVTTSAPWPVAQTYTLEVSHP
jgi:hypothetical protein